MVVLSGVAVFDIVTCCNFFVSAMRDNERFGLASWDGKQQKHVYRFGSNLSPADRSELVSKKNGNGTKPKPDNKSAAPKPNSNKKDVQKKPQKKAPVKKEPQFMAA